MPRRFLLDTNTVSFHIRRFSAALERRLRFGLARRPGLAIGPLVEEVLAGIDILPLTSASAAAYGRIRARLEAAGTPIGPLDLMIAAQAVALGLTLVTPNFDEFRRVPGLACEDWTR